MNIEQLRHFSEIARCGSFNKAAEALYMTQSNLSHSIKKLEKELGTPVFIRTNTGVTLTPYGNELLPYTQSLLTQLSQVPGHVSTKAGKSVQRLSVAGCELRLSSYIVSEILNAHSDEGIHIAYHDVSGEETLSMVSSGTADIGAYAISGANVDFSLRKLKSAEVEFVSLIKNPATVSVGPKNPLFTREEDWVTPDMLKDFPILARFSDFPTALHKELGLIQNNSIIQCRTRAARMEVLTNTTAISVGTTPISVYQKIDMFKTRKAFKLKGTEYYSEMGYVKRTDTLLTPLAQEFAQRMRELLRD